MVANRFAPNKPAAKPAVDLQPPAILPRAVPLLECVPNVSEGQRQDIVDRIATAASSVKGVALLDRSSDPDHNRSVLTLAGRTDPLLNGMLELYRVALDAIDLSQHRGVHPRVGAVDVVPFVPLEETLMDEAIAAARSLGQRVAERFALPVYLYEEAATRPQRRNLAEIRRAALAELSQKIATDDWVPDFGPPKVHPTAGVTLIGARWFLIAFNVFLSTKDVVVAKRIARTVRQSGGGLPALKAIGVYLERRGCAQVSMNLVDYRRTSMAEALHRVQEEARACQTEVVGSEIVGLLPEEAVAQSFGESPEIGDMTRDKVLEHRLARQL